MATSISLNNRDWSGQPVGKATYNFTSNITSSSAWTLIQIGGVSNALPVIKAYVSGEATSPASFGANPDDRLIELQIRHVPRGADENSGSAVNMVFPILKWKAGETSTEKEIQIPVECFLNTDGIPDGNMYARLVTRDGVTFTGVDMVLSIIGISDTIFSPIAEFSTTNNLYATGAAANANTTNELPAATTGYIEGDFTQFGYFGDIKLSNRIGLTPSGDVGGTPKYYWEYTTGDATGNTPRANAMHNGVAVVTDVVCAEGDTLTVHRASGGTITYRKNGVTEATGGTTDTVAMKGEVQLVSVYGRALGIRMDIGAGAISPTFENLSNITGF